MPEKGTIPKPAHVQHPSLRATFAKDPRSLRAADVRFSRKRVANVLQMLRKCSANATLTCSIQAPRGMKINKPTWWLDFIEIIYIIDE
jgi:hypothetical protein